MRAKQEFLELPISRKQQRTGCVIPQQFVAAKFNRKTGAETVGAGSPLGALERY